MRIEDIETEWANDSKIDDKTLDKAAVLGPQLHSKYVDLWVTAKLKLAKEKKEFNILKKMKTKYYRGELSREELTKLGWEQYQLRKIPRPEIKEVLEGDEDVANQGLKVEYLETMVGLLESILTTIKNRSFDIKNSIEYKKFLVGN